MKCFFAIIILVLVQFSGLAQDKSKSKDIAAVEVRIEELRQAMINADGAKLKELTSEGLSYGHSSGQLQNQTTFIEKIVNGESDFVRIVLQDQTIEINENLAIVHHNLVAHTKDSGVDKDIKIGIMLIWKKQKHKWILIARQAFKLPS